MVAILNLSATRYHDRRLRQVYRSSGWPCLDVVEIELLVMGYLERVQCPGKAESLRVTAQGLARIADSLQKNRSALLTHESLVDRVARQQMQQGRIAFQKLTLMAKPSDDWLDLRPDVFSIRNTSKEDYIQPVIHEIKVSRADLRSDLKKPDKRAGYIALSSEFYYVLMHGIATADDIPPECGVIVATAAGLETVRVSPRRHTKLSFDTWMTLAKSPRCLRDDDPDPCL